MNASTTAAVRAIEHGEREIAAGLNLLALAIADSEPAPVRIVLLQTAELKVHRAAVIDGIPGRMTFEADNLDEATVLHDLSAVPDDADLCSRCFGDADPGADADFPAAADTPGDVAPGA